MQKSGGGNKVKVTEEGGFHGGDGVALVMRGGCGTSHVIDLRDLQAGGMRVERKRRAGGGWGAEGRPQT